MTAPTRVLILAGSFSEAAKYAKGMQLKQYRYGVNAHSVTNFRPDDIVELPGYESRRDKHAFGTIIRNAARRGVQVRKDEYIPPPPPPAPQYGDPEYLADYLLGDVAAAEEVILSTPADVVDKVLASQTDAMSGLIAGVTDALAQKQDDFVESAPQDERVNDAKPAEPVQNKVSGRGKKSSPKATKTPIPPKTVTSDVDDLFED